MALTSKNIKNVLRKAEKNKRNNLVLWPYIAYLEAALQSLDILDVYRGGKDYCDLKMNITYTTKFLFWSKLNTRKERKDELIIRLCKEYLETIEVE